MEISAGPKYLHYEPVDVFTTSLIVVTKYPIRGNLKEWGLDLAFCLRGYSPSWQERYENDLSGHSASTVRKKGGDADTQSLSPVYLIKDPFHRTA